MIWSNRSKKSIPTQKPIKEGTKENLPSFELCSKDGMSRLQIDAATMTPAAKPDKALSTPSLRLFFKRNTEAAPNDVPKNGIRMP